MHARLTHESKPTCTPRQRGNDPDPDPEPPMAPPVIILSTSNGLGSGKNQEPGSSDPNSAAEPRPHTSLPTTSKSTHTVERYNFRKRPGIKKTESEPEPEFEPEPDSAPPIIILSAPKRPASLSPIHTFSPSRSESSPQSQPRKRSRIMGSKASKLSSKVQGEHSKLQPAVANSDKEQMKEPANYYSHRSKSMRRKAGRNAAGESPATAP